MVWDDFAPYGFLVLKAKKKTLPSTMKRTKSTSSSTSPSTKRQKREPTVDTVKYIYKVPCLFPASTTLTLVQTREQRKQREQKNETKSKMTHLRSIQGTYIDAHVFVITRSHPMIFLQLTFCSWQIDCAYQNT